MADQWTSELVRSAVHNSGALEWDPDVVADLRWMPGTEVLNNWHRVWRWGPLIGRAALAFTSIEAGSATDDLSAPHDIPKGFDRTMAGQFVGLTAEGSAPVRWLAFRAPRLVALEVRDQRPIVVWDSADNGAVLLSESGDGPHRRLRARFTDHSAVGLRMDVDDRARMLGAAER
ncbi:hypothetical protein ACIA8G_19410 [Lentzea sp. NPDC051213]|uniref:hypothetical protein n=1 Tax=Lentzea sp. NPDC051213 TaxID=3364126 RepID=UPI0037B4F93B